MYRDHTVGVVVTAYNEEELVGDVIDSLPGFVDRVYAVDDCSTDRTWEEITARAPATRADTAPVPDGGRPRESTVVPIRHERNRGVGGAIKSGFRQAISDDMDVVAVMDGDGQMDPDQLDRLLDPIIDGRASYAKGNRLSKPSHIGSMSLFRLVGNVVLTLLTRIASGYWRMRDPQNGYNAIDAATLEQLSLSALHDRYGFRNDMLIRLSVQGATIADVAMPAVYGDEESAIRYRSFVPRLSWLLARRFCWRLGTQLESPDVSRPGATSVLAGIAVIARVRSRKRLPTWIEKLGTALGGLVFLFTMVEDRYANDETITIDQDE